MSDFQELKSYIRFQLSNLKAQNLHHEFENLSRHFARLRICENILPSTGPVGSFGDQGRDFETYRSYLQSTPIALSTFIAMSNHGDNIVFACSLKEKIYDKIKADLKTICSGDTKVDSVYYFCERNLPVGKRHPLQKWAKTEYKVLLEVFDGEALAEQLTNLDVFWIAEKYLDVPSNMFPTLHDYSEKYQQYKINWLDENGNPLNYAHFTQIKYALRTSTYKESAKPDLLKWLHKMEIFLTDEFPQNMRRKAIYEICVGNLRGLNNLTESKSQVIEYFSENSNLCRASDIEDAVVLLTYCSAAFMQHHFMIDEELLRKWADELVCVIDNHLGHSINNEFKCKLLQLRGMIEFVPFKTDFDIYKAFPWWKKMLQIVQWEPLFPLEDFVDTLTELVQHFGEDEEFVSISDRANELFANRTHGYVLADKCRKMALAYYNNDNFILCIRQLHKVRVNWHSAETLVGSLYAMLLLANCYVRLGLAYASKFYFMCIFHLAYSNEGDEFKQFIPKALFGLGNSAYSAGEWYLFFGIAKSAFRLHNTFEDTPGNYEKDDNALPLIAHCTISLKIIERFCSVEIYKTIKDDIINWEITTRFRDLILKPENKALNYWNDVDNNELAKKASEEMSNRPFSDFGKRRIIQWNALGIHWIIESENQLQTVCISEELAAISQIIIAELSTVDLVLLPVEVHIEVIVAKVDIIQIKHKPDNERISYQITIQEQYSSIDERSEEMRSQALSIILLILQTCSSLNKRSFDKVLDKLLRDGLTHKTFWVRPYSEMCEYQMENNDYLKLNKINYEPIFNEEEFKGCINEQLAWVNSEGPGYSKSKADKMIKGRYINGIMPVRLTLPKLIQSPKLIALIRKYKNRGYQDWKILLMINNIALNYRAKKLINNTYDYQEYQRQMSLMVVREETEDDIPVPVDVFSEEAFEMHDRVAPMLAAKSWGLEIKISTPNIDAVNKLMNERYHFNEDDVPHDNLFDLPEQ